MKKNLIIFKTKLKKIFRRMGILATQILKMLNTDSRKKTKTLEIKKQMEKREKEVYKSVFWLTTLSVRFGLKIKIIVIITVLFLSLSCVKKEQDPVCKEYFSKNRTKKEFNEKNIDEQLILLECALEQYPANATYADYISERGSSLTPILLEKLDRLKENPSYDNDKKIYAIILVFESLSVFNEIENKEQTIILLKEAISAIQSRFVKNQATKSLNYIINPENDNPDLY